VPADVPSDIHSSRPEPDFDAAKYSFPSNAVIQAGVLPETPGLMSATSVVPAVVPSVRHSS
jgi:hypothetical protein